LLGPGEAEWLPRLNLELNNLRAAFDWSLRGKDPPVALRLAGLTRHLWEIRGAFDEGITWIDRAIGAAGEGAPVSDRARAQRARIDLLQNKGVVYDSQGQKEPVRRQAERALELSREAGEPAGIADALILLSYFHATDPLPQLRRRELAQEALAQARGAGDDRLAAIAMRDMALALPVEQALPELHQAAAALRRVGDRRRLLGLYSSAAYNAIKSGSPDLAGPLLDQILPIVTELGDPLAMLGPWGNIGLAALFSDDLERARVAFESQLRLCVEHGVTWLIPESLAGLAALALTEDERERAALMLGAARQYGDYGDDDVIEQFERRFWSSARPALGEARWQAAAEEGAALSLEQIVELALGEVATEPAPL
jgi:hypothetical protein